MYNEIDSDEVSEIEDFDELINSSDEFSSRSDRKKQKKEKPIQIYLDKTLMWESLSEYYELCKRNPNARITIKLAEMVDRIIEEMSHCPNFSGYVKQENWLEDMKGDARVKAFKAVTEQSFDLYTCADILAILPSKDDEADTIFYYGKNAKKNHIASDKSIKFDTIEECKNGIRSIRKGKTILLKDNGLDLSTIKRKTNKTGYIIIERRLIDKDDVIDHNTNTITFKANPFGFYTTIVWNCFINRIKKEKEEKEKRAIFQEHVYESMYAEEAWKNVRRPKIFYDDEENSFIVDSKE